MKTATLLLTMGAIVMAGQAGADDKTVSTTVRNGNSFATVTQSGDSATAVKRIEKRPGYTRIEQKSGNSSSVVVQSSDPADSQDLKQQLPQDIQYLLKMLGQ